MSFVICEKCKQWIPVSEDSTDAVVFCTGCGHWTPHSKMPFSAWFPGLLQKSSEKHVLSDAKSKLGGEYSGEKSIWQTNVTDVLTNIKHPWKWIVGALLGSAVVLCLLWTFMPGDEVMSHHSGWNEAHQRAEKLDQLPAEELQEFIDQYHDNRTFLARCPKRWQPVITDAEGRWVQRYLPKMPAILDRMLSKNEERLATKDIDALVKKAADLSGYQKRIQGAVEAWQSAQVDTVVNRRWQELPLADEVHYKSMKETSDLWSGWAAQTRVSLRSAEAAWQIRSGEFLAKELDQLPARSLEDFYKRAKERGFIGSSFSEQKVVLEKAELAWGERSVAILVKELDQLKSADREEFARGRLERAEYIKLFPNLGPTLRAGEMNWGERSVAILVKELDQLKPADREEFARGRLERAEYIKLFANLGPTLRTGEVNWGLRTVEALKPQVELHCKTAPLKATQLLQQWTRDFSDCELLNDLSSPLLPLRRQAVKACLEEAKRQNLDLLKKAQYQLALEKAQQLNDQLSAEASVVGLQRELADFFSCYLLFAELAQVPPRAVRAVDRTPEWRIEGKELVQKNSQPGYDGLIFFGDRTWSDYDVEVEGQGNPSDFAVCFRAEPNNFLFAPIGGWGNSMHGIIKRVKGNEEAIFQVKGSVEAGKWYRIRIEARGSQFKIHLDGQKLFEERIDGFDRGGIGFRTYSCTARYRNIRVTDPSGKVLFEGLPNLK